MTRNIAILAMALAVSLGGCRTTQEAMLDSDQVTAELRTIQTKTFEDVKKESAMRAVIQTLQDLNFEVHDANGTVGLVRAVKYLGTSAVNVNVNVKESDADVSIRMNANFHNNPVVEADHYQKFFTALSKSIFLQDNM